jgi:hypothetical protein
MSKAREAIERYAVKIQGSGSNRSEDKHGNQSGLYRRS